MTNSRPGGHRHAARTAEASVAGDQGWAVPATLFSVASGFDRHSSSGAKEAPRCTTTQRRGGPTMTTGPCWRRTTTRSSRTGERCPDPGPDPWPADSRVRGRVRPAARQSAARMFRLGSRRRRPGSDGSDHAGGVVARRAGLSAQACRDVRTRVATTSSERRRAKGVERKARSRAVEAAPVQALSMSFSRALLPGCTRSVTTAPLTLATMICPTSS